MKTLFKILFVFVLLSLSAVIFVAFLVLEPEPRVTDGNPPSPAEVRQAREFVRGVRSALNAEDSTVSEFQTSVDELNAALKLGARFVRGFRGQVRAEGDEVVGDASLPVKIGAATHWLNVTMVAPAFEGQFELAAVQLGPLTLNPDFTREALRVGANWIFGNDLGNTVLSAASRMEVREPDVIFTLTLGEMGGNGIMRGVFGTLRGQEMPGTDEIALYYRLIREAMEEGRLPQTGSYLPYLQFTLNAAAERATRDQASNAYTSALFALTYICGAKDFTLVVGGLVVGDLDGGRDWSASCAGVTFNDRIDSRRHFTTAAAIQAASNRGFSVSVGEFKELYDSLHGGFDFTDLAANNSGIRMSNRFMGTPASEWPGLIARIKEEADVIIAYDGIPQIMSQANFDAQFGDIDSPEYRDMLARIEARIDALPLHR